MRSVCASAAARSCSITRTDTRRRVRSFTRPEGAGRLSRGAARRRSAWRGPAPEPVRPVRGSTTSSGWSTIRPRSLAFAPGAASAGARAAGRHLPLLFRAGWPAAAAGTRYVLTGRFARDLTPCDGERGCAARVLSSRPSGAMSGVQGDSRVRRLRGRDGQLPGACTGGCRLLAGSSSRIAVLRAIDRRRRLAARERALRGCASAGARTDPGGAGGSPSHLRRVRDGDLAQGDCCGTSPRPRGFSGHLHRYRHQLLRPRRRLGPRRC